MDDARPISAFDAPRQPGFPRKPEGWPASQDTEAAPSRLAPCPPTAVLLERYVGLIGVALDPARKRKAGHSVRPCGNPEGLPPPYHLSSRRQRLDQRVIVNRAAVQMTYARRFCNSTRPHRCGTVATARHLRQQPPTVQF